MRHHHTGLPGETPHLRRGGHHARVLEEDHAGGHPPGQQSLGRPGRLERGLLPDPEGSYRGRHVGIIN